MTANAEVILETQELLQIPEGSLIYDKEKQASVEVPILRQRGQTQGCCQDWNFQRREDGAGRQFAQGKHQVVLQ